MIKKSTNKVLVLSLLFLVILSCSINNDYPWTSIALDEIIIDNTDKLVLVDFETEWCVWCDRLDTDTYTDQRVIEFAKKNLISKKIDAEKNNGPQQKKKYRVKGYPTILLLDSEGNEIDRIIGYRPPEEFFNELNRIKNRENTLSDLITRYKQSINNSSVKIDLAEKYILMNLPDSARLLLDNIYSFQKKKHQLDFSVSFNLSQLYYKIRSLDRSIEILDQIVESGVDSSDIAYFFRLLYKSKRSSDIDALLEYAELSENIDRKQKSYWQIIRILKKHKRDPSLEAELYLKVIDLYTSDYKYLPSLLNGFAWRMTELEKNLDIALVKINKALEYGEDIKILDTKAEVLWKLNRSEEAVEIIEKCILSDPQNKYYKDQKKKFLSAST
jgi:thioredoxin-related protein